MASRLHRLIAQRVAHTCSSRRRPIPDSVRKTILALEKAGSRPQKIADKLDVTLATVMRVLSGDADDDASCPACQPENRSNDHRGDFIPLYAADTTLAEESCTHCLHSLLRLALDRATTLEKDLQVHHLVTTAGHPALKFERRPPTPILDALKKAGWRWEPRDRLWIDRSQKAAIPAGVPLPATPKVLTARPPVVHRHRHTAADATVH